MLNVKMMFTVSAFSLSMFACAANTEDTTDNLGSEEDLTASKFAFQLASTKSWGNVRNQVGAPESEAITTSCKFEYYSSAALKSAIYKEFEGYNVKYKSSLHSFGWAYSCLQYRGDELLGEGPSEGVFVLRKASVKSNEILVDNFGAGFNEVVNPFSEKPITWKITTEDAANPSQKIRVSAYKNQDGTELPKTPADVYGRDIVLSQK